MIMLLAVLALINSIEYIELDAIIGHLAVISGLTLYFHSITAVFSSL